MLSSLIHPVSFMIVMYISAIIVLAEYGKVLRKDPEYLNFLKRWNQDYSPFMSTEFFPIFMVSMFGLLPLIGPALSLTNSEKRCDLLHIHNRLFNFLSVSFILSYFKENFTLYYQAWCFY